MVRNDGLHDAHQTTTTQYRPHLRFDASSFRYQTTKDRRSTPKEMRSNASMTADATRLPSKGIVVTSRSHGRSPELTYYPKRDSCDALMRSRVNSEPFNFENPCNSSTERRSVHMGQSRVVSN